MVITFQKVKAEPKGDKPEAKASKDTKATFDTTPSWSDLCLRVERIFPDMAAEAYSLQCNGMDLSENLWPRAVLPSKPPAGPLQVSLKVRSSSYLSACRHAMAAAVVQQVSMPVPRCMCMHVYAPIRCHVYTVFCIGR